MRQPIMSKSASEIVAQMRSDAARWGEFEDWWDEDWSWDALPSKLQYEAIGRISLQDYWRDQVGQLVEFEGRRWTIAHLPPCSRDGSVVCQAWSEAKGNRFWDALDRRFPDVPLPIVDVVFVHQISPQPALLHGVVFPEWAKERGDKVISAHFKKCLFLGWCSFSKGKIANSFFDEARFIGDAAYFDSVDFLGGGAHFSEAKILTGIITFSEAKFRGGAYFRKSRFKSANFSEAVFSQGCDFSDAGFDSGLNFIGAEFGGGYAHFDRIAVGGVADFSFAKFESATSFTDAVFQYDAYFRCGKGGKFAAAADFNGAIFDRAADFSGRSFNQATDFRGAIFGGLPLFYDCQLPKETLFDAISFESRPWLDPLWETTLEQDLEREERERIRRRQIRFHSSIIERRSTRLSELATALPPWEAWNRRAKSFEYAFRALRQLSAIIGNVEDEMNFHSLELDARRARKDVPLFERGMIVLYRWLSDYGRSMWRPIWVLISFAAAIVLVVTSLTRWALDEAKLLRGNVPMPSSAEIATYILRNFIPPPPVWSENLGRTWAVGLDDAARSLLFLVGTLETLVFTVLVALFLIALRRRFQIRV